MFSFKCLPLRVANARASVRSAALGTPSRCDAFLSTEKYNVTYDTQSLYHIKNSTLCVFKLNVLITSSNSFKYISRDLLLLPPAWHLQTGAVSCASVCLLAALICICVDNEDAVAGSMAVSFCVVFAAMVVLLFTCVIIPSALLTFCGHHGRVV